MNAIDKCYNCKRSYRDSNDRKMFCEIKNKVLYDGNQHTEEYYWCNGKYQQQIGKEGIQC